MHRPFQPESRLCRSVLLVAPLLLLMCLQSGCHACWEVDRHCGSGMHMSGGGDGEAALIIVAFYLALAIPYLISEAWRSCQ